MQTVMITGGTGLVGSALTKHLLDKGFAVVILTRKLPAKADSNPGVSYALWNVPEKIIDLHAIQKCDYIMHLAGAPVMDKRWTANYKKEILESRTKSSALLVETLQQNSNKVKAVICSSAIGRYGSSDERTEKQAGFNETDEAAQNFLGDVSKAWEQSTKPLIELGKRLVTLRTGIVLSNDGGAMPEFEKPIKFGIAGIFGSGKQIMSWIHIEDLCRIFSNAIINEELNGVYNAVAPATISNKAFILDLAKKIKGRFFIPLHVPTFLLKIILGERSIEVFKSTKVSCKKIKQTGFTFLYPTIEAALNQLCAKS
jgi:uncharacterized protein (TIGR01777 family)